MRGRLAALLATGALLAPAAGAADTAGGELVHFVGSHDADALLGHARVAAPLRRLLGDAWPQLIANLAVRGAVDLVSGELSLAGNAVHGGGLEEAVLCVALRREALSAAIFSQGSITVYSSEAGYEAQGLCIKDWITLVNSGHVDRLRQPANVRMSAE